MRVLAADVLTRQEGAQLLSHLPQPQLIAIVGAMDLELRAQVEELLLPVPRAPTPRRGSLKRSLAFLSRARHGRAVCRTSALCSKLLGTHLMTKSLALATCP